MFIQRSAPQRASALAEVAGTFGQQGAYRSWGRYIVGKCRQHPATNSAGDRGSACVVWALSIAPRVSAICTAVLFCTAAAGMASIETAMLTASKKARIRFFIVGSSLWEGVSRRAVHCCTQRLNGVEPGGTPGRQISKQDTDAHRDGKGHQSSIHRGSHGDALAVQEHRQHLVGNAGDHIPQHNAQYAAQCRGGGGLGNSARGMLRPHCLADADLPGALCDRHQHDVHNADTASSDMLAIAVRMMTTILISAFCCSSHRITGLIF